MGVSTPINVGDVWVLNSVGDLGTGIGAIPPGAQVTVDSISPPFTPGVGQSAEPTVSCTYAFTDFGYDGGVLVESTNRRRLAFPESDFTSLFAPEGSG